MRTQSKLATCVLLLAVSFGCSKTTKQASVTTADGGTSAAPSGTDAKRDDKALVRFINATPNPTDLMFGDAVAFSSVAPLAVSPYTELSTSRHEFKLYPAGNDSGDALASNSEGPMAGKHYTILAVNDEKGKVILNPIGDDLTEPAAGKAKIRVIHAAPGVEKVDLYPVGVAKAILSGVSFDHATGYEEVDPAYAELDLRVAGSKKNEVKITNVNLAPGRSYTVVVTGGNGQPLNAQVIEDRLAGSIG